MILDGFLIGIIATLSAVAGLFFLRFFRKTGDLLFLAFGVAFMIEAVNRLRFLSLEMPGEGAASIYLVRLVAYLIILAAILYKNFGARR